MHSNRVIALVVATLVLAATVAGAQGTAARTGRADRAQAKIAAQRSMRDGLLRGVKLSDAEKARMKEVQAKYRTDAMAFRESMKPALAEARAARQRGDTAAVRAVLDRTRVERAKARTLREQHVAAVRLALSAENQETFDANVKQVKAQAASRIKAGRGDGARHGRTPGKALGRMRPNT